MNVQLAAILYAILAAIPAAMHLALAAGAPLGRFTIGGRFPGRLPAAWRVLAVVQAGLLAGMSIVVLDHAGVTALGSPRWLIWPVLGLTALTLLANAASPSRPERRLWTPVAAGMMAAAIAAVVGAP